VVVVPARAARVAILLQTGQLQPEQMPETAVEEYQQQLPERPFVMRPVVAAAFTGTAETLEPVVLALRQTQQLAVLAEKVAFCQTLH
jgi:hypothetical protein